MVGLLLLVMELVWVHFVTIRSVLHAGSLNVEIGFSGGPLFCFWYFHCGFEDYLRCYICKSCHLYQNWVGFALALFPWASLFREVQAGRCEIGSVGDHYFLVLGVFFWILALYLCVLDKRWWECHKFHCGGQRLWLTAISTLASLSSGSFACQLLVDTRVQERHTTIYYSYKHYFNTTLWACLDIETMLR
jgi:hypothetical protein